MNQLLAALLLGALVLPGFAPSAHAQYPERTATLVSGFPPGGMVEVEYRSGDKLHADLMQEYRAHTELLRNAGMLKK